MTKLMVRQGYLKFMRLGPVEFGEQSRWAHAPERFGMWAFPWPYFEMFYAYHKYLDLLPKELRLDERRRPPLSGYTNDEGKTPRSYAEVEAGDFYPSGEWFTKRDQWVETVGKRILPMRTFWYRGDLYSHFLPSGEVGGYSMVSGDVEGTDWSLMSTDAFVRFTKSTHGDRQVYSKSMVPARSGSDHLEVFIPRKRGTIRSFHEKGHSK